MPAAAVILMHLGDETVAVSGHGAHKTRIAGIITKYAANLLDALGKRGIGDHAACPHLIEKPLLADQLPVLTHQQDQRVEIACVEREARPVTAQAAIIRVEH